MKKISLILIMLFSLFLFTPTYAAECYTVESMTAVIKAGGANIVHTGYVEDGLTYTFYYHVNLPTILGLGFDANGCAVKSMELTPAQFRDVTGVVIS